MIRICLTWAHEQNVPPQGNCLSNTVWRYLVVLEASFVQGGSYQLCEGAHLGKFEERVSLLTWADNRREIVDTHFGHERSEKSMPLTKSAILSKSLEGFVSKFAKKTLSFFCSEKSGQTSLKFE